MPDPTAEATVAAEKYDYIIVGSGAGGAPLAARLAQAGKKVLVLEAGPNHALLPLSDAAHEVTRVPALHGVSSEHEGLAWRFFVEHYQRGADGGLPDGIPEDPKWHGTRPTTGVAAENTGIFYPRATGIGGCTIHNAMITIAGPDSDWDELADFLGDPSWRGPRMRPYFEKVEHNDYRPIPDIRRSKCRPAWKYAWDGVRWLVGFAPDPTGGRHGYSGWLHTNVADVSLGLGDRQLVKMLRAALHRSKKKGLDRAWTLVSTFLRGRVWQSLDPNHYQTQEQSPEGVVLIPVAVHGARAATRPGAQTPYGRLGWRSSPRELLLATLSSHPGNLTIETHCFVTKILLIDDPDGTKPPRAIGVEFLRGERLYRASVNPEEPATGPEQEFVKAGGEVILCGGTFNTPQLLMLSGIGPRTSNGHIGDDAGELLPPGATLVEFASLPCRVHLPGVGKNLQDRYEVSVVGQMKKPFSLLKDAAFRLPDDPQKPDRHLRQFRDKGTGLYASNGGVLGIFKRSRHDLPQPDLFIFGVPLAFRGYQVGYSVQDDSEKQDKHGRFSWIILKSHSGNNDGVVKLRSDNPLDTPLINFHSFRTRSAPNESDEDPDVLALAEGVKFARGILEDASRIVTNEVHPGRQLVPENDTDALHRWIRRDAWGHHACGTCRMGPDGDPRAVLDSRFRVRGVSGLRVVDASIFPKIPGYFIVTNIYMASEKAADVILEDAGSKAMGEPSVYPHELKSLEAKAIAIRRKRLAGDLADATEADVATIIDHHGKWSTGVTGLALSGGGIRSATMCLGILQGFAKGRWLRKFDIMSTVSGGGYIGGFLGRFYDRLRPDHPGDKEPRTTLHPADHIEQELTSQHSGILSWLRRHGNYLAPQGSGDGRLNFAVFLRNLLSVHLVIGLALFAMFGLGNGLRYGVIDPLKTSAGLVFDCSDLPIGHLISSWFGPFFSPWFLFVELLILFLVVPRIVGYWIVSQDQHEAFKAIPLTVLIVVSGVLLYMGVKDGLQPELVLSGLSLLTSVIQVELAWWRGSFREASMGSGTVETQRLRTRNYLTYDLGLALALTGIATAFFVIDALAHGLHQWQVAGSMTYAKAFAGLIAAILAAMPTARMLAGFLDDSSTGRPSAFVRVLKRDIVAGLMAAALFSLPLVFYSFASHAAFEGGTNPGLGWMLTIGAVLMTVAFTHPSAVTFVNRSSLSATYAARLARAYLGASNLFRQRPAGANVTEVIDGDDVASIRDYRPHEASGPLHLINMTLNQTVDRESQLAKRDRNGENLAVSCIGMTVGEKWHSAWGDSVMHGAAPNRKGPSRLNPLGWTPGTKHPLVDQLGRPADQVEMLSLRMWIALSGAAVDAGQGRATQLGTAVLMGLVNMRTGYWWDSGIAHADRSGFPELPFTRRLLYLIPRFFTTQALLLYEWVARYPGPTERFWHVADGGYFENLGGYELVRRRIPRMIVCDGTADPEYQLEDLAELVRKVRIDFGAIIESFTPQNVLDYVPNALQNRVGTLDDLAPKTKDGSSLPTSTTHAALLWVRYADDLNQKSVMLYLKASVTGDESADVEHYHTSHPEFPHEATEDQFFDEPQWESYRMLGEHMAVNLVTAGDWFWQIPV